MVSIYLRFVFLLVSLYTFLNGIVAYYTLSVLTPYWVVFVVIGSVGVLVIGTIGEEDH